jgi:hypothetical protein
LSPAAVEVGQRDRQVGRLSPLPRDAGFEQHLDVAEGLRPGVGG